MDLVEELKTKPGQYLLVQSKQCEGSVSQQHIMCVNLIVCYDESYIICYNFELYAKPNGLDISNPF